MGEHATLRTALAGLWLGVIATGCAAHTPPARDIVLLARGMAFVAEEQPDSPNPLIRLRAGERVRLVLRNEAPGLLHDVVIPAFDVEIAQMRAGESRHVTFTVPAVAGQHEYRCRPHSAMMKGIVEVAP